MGNIVDLPVSSIVGTASAVFLVSVAAYYRLPAPRKNPIESAEVDDKFEGEGRARRNIIAKESLRAVPPDATGIDTIYALWKNSIKQYASSPCLGSRKIEGDKRGEYVWETYEQVGQRLTNFGSGLVNLGLKKGDRIGFYAKNCAEWVVGAEACNAYSMICVALYDTLGADNREFVVNHAEISAIVCTPDLVGNVLALDEPCPLLKYVIVIGAAGERDDKHVAKGSRLLMKTFEEVEALGRANSHPHIPPSPSDLMTIMYTSGTTARPKGVMITHGNLIAMVSSAPAALHKLTNTDVFMSYLPLAHILERAAEETVYYHGGAVGFYQGDPRKLMEDITALRPTLFAGVPKIFERVMGGVKAKVAAGGALKQKLFSMAYSYKRRAMLAGVRTPICDAVVFKATKAALGGRVRQIITGGAPISPECQEFIEICFCAPCVQGYGLTETMGGACITTVRQYQRAGNVGPPLACCEIKLADAGNYKHTDKPCPQGEVCIAGPNVALGYYKDEVKTREDFRKENGKIWFHTGDVGRWNADGTLSIVGRVKDIFKNLLGEYIAPEKLESVYNGCKFAISSYVYGDTMDSRLIGVLVIDPVKAKGWAQEHGVEYNETTNASGTPIADPAILKNPDFYKDVMADLETCAKRAKLQRFEYVSAVHLENEPWVPETNLVTSALKNKRPELAKFYSKELDALYKQLGPLSH